MEWRLGTMGFGYDDWSGVFYPRSIAKGDWLTFYARHFNAVELDTTFHAAPDATRVRRWAAAVPGDFRFCVKTPRAVTHDMPLDRAFPPMRDFLSIVQEMGEKLGAVLLQFAPQFTADQSDALDAFLTRVRHDFPDVPLAVELRNRSWGTQRTLDVLRLHRCALVAAEYLSGPRRVLVTADFLYVRWIGEHGRYPDHKEEREDMAEPLAWWKDELERAASVVPTTFGFFNNDYAGYAVATCDRFRQMIGQPVPPLEGEAQGQLFG